MKTSRGWNPYQDADTEGLGEPTEPDEPVRASYYDELVTRAEDGDLAATRDLFQDLERLLAGFADGNNAVFRSPSVRDFLARKLRFALAAKRGDVGKVLGLGIGKNGKRYSDLDHVRDEFVGWYVQSTRDLGLTGREVCEDQWPDEFDKCKEWVNARLPDNIDEKTLRMWRKLARGNLYINDVFANFLRSQRN